MRAYFDYVQAGERGAEGTTKPKTASLFSSMDLDTVTLDDALRLLALPRTIGAHPEDGVPITAHTGRLGPYVKWGSETRSLESEDRIFTIDPDGALALLAQPKRGRGTVAPLRELGEDPNSGEIVWSKPDATGPTHRRRRCIAPHRRHHRGDLDRRRLLAERRAGCATTEAEAGAAEEHVGPGLVTAGRSDISRTAPDRVGETRSDRAGPRPAASVLRTAVRRSIVSRSSPEDCGSRERRHPHRIGSGWCGVVSVRHGETMCRGRQVPAADSHRALILPPGKVRN
jgi:DNA topoisomerase-1